MKLHFHGLGIVADVLTGFAFQCFEHGLNVQCLCACMLLLALLFSAFVIFAWFVRTRVFCVSGVGVRGNHVLSCFGVFCLLRCSWCY